MNGQKDKEIIEDLTDCTSKNIQKYKKLTQRALDKLYELPCGCEKVALKDRIVSGKLLKLKNLLP